MKRIAAIALLAACAAVPGMANGDETKAPVESAVEVVGADDVAPGIVLAWGYVDSERAECVKGRTVKYQAGPTRKRGDLNTLDTAKTSKHGGWAVILQQADLGGEQQAKLVARDKSPKCTGDVDVVVAR